MLPTIIPFSALRISLYLTNVTDHFNIREKDDRSQYLFKRKI